MIFKGGGKKGHTMVYNTVSPDVAAVQGLSRGPTHPSERLPSAF